MSPLLLVVLLVPPPDPLQQVKWCVVVVFIKTKIYIEKDRDHGRKGEREAGRDNEREGERQTEGERELC